MTEFRQLYVDVAPVSSTLMAAIESAKKELEHDMEAFIWPEQDHRQCDICDRREAGSGALKGRWGDE